MKTLAMLLAVVMGAVEWPRANCSTARSYFRPGDSVVAFTPSNFIGETKGKVSGWSDAVNATFADQDVTIPEWSIGKVVKRFPRASGTYLVEMGVGGKVVVLGPRGQVHEG